jgi:eukaryotic-like serine/threonine-protein kinase
MGSFALPVAALVAAAAVCWLAYIAVKLFAPAGAIVTVPTLVGLSYGDAQSAAKRAGVGITIVARKPDFHAPLGQVLGQLPAAGEHVRQGRVVDVVVSQGKPTTKIPNVANLSVREATVALENAKLALGTVTQRLDSAVSEGTVLDQEPEAFGEVPAGTAVSLVVATGRPIAYAPNFVGLTLAEAVGAAKQAGVSLVMPATTLAIAPGAPPKGVIAAQDPAAGAQLSPNERIALEVSGGALPTMPPSPTALPPASPVPSTQSQSPVASPAPSVSPSPLLASPGAVRGMRVSVALPSSPSPIRIRVILLDATGQRTLYDQQTRGGFTLTFDLKVTGAGTLQTYVGDQLVNSTPL